MTQGQGRLTVGRAGRRTEGRHERQLRRTLTAWARQAHLVGDDNAAIRDGLRAAARNLDRAEADPDTSPYAQQMITKFYIEMLMAQRPPVVDTDTGADDAWSAALRDLTRAQ